MGAVHRYKFIPTDCPSVYRLIPTGCPSPLRGCGVVDLEVRPLDIGPPRTNVPERQATEHLGGVADLSEHGADMTKPREPLRGRHPMRILNVEDEDVEDQILWQQHQWC